MKTTKLLKELETVADILPRDAAEAADHLNILIDTLRDESKARKKAKKRGITVRMGAVTGNLR